MATVSAPASAPSSTISAEKTKTAEDLKAKAELKKKEMKKEELQREAAKKDASQAPTKTPEPTHPRRTDVMA